MLSQNANNAANVPAFNPGKMTSAQLRAFEKLVRDAKFAAAEEERKAKPVAQRGRGVMDAIYACTLRSPQLKGDELFKLILLEIKVPDSNGRKASKSAALTIAADFKHAARFLGACTEEQRKAFFAAVKQ